jgi:4-amino-4-deoxy-L-arabinose transferase-like glycosyltransferase
VGDPIPGVSDAATAARVDPSAAGREAPAILLLIGGAAAVAAVIGVRGDFPLSDDWSYAFSARTLCMTGTVRFLPWTGASLLLQAWYGAALCWLFGFSFDVLRLSTVLLATAGAVGFFLLLGRLGVRGPARALATALWALDPLYVNLAFTFMTDVPCAVLAVWAAYCYVRGFDEPERMRWLLAGGLFAAAALLVRQHGIFVAAAATVAALLARDRPAAARLRDAVAAGGLPAHAFVAFHQWLFAWHGAPSGGGSKLTDAQGVHALGLVNCAFRGIETLGLLLAPLAIAMRRDVVARHPRLVPAVATTLALLAALLYRREGALMFYLTNVMYDLGLGAASLRDTQFLALRPPLQLGPAFGVALTVVATLAAGVLLTALADAARRLRDPRHACVVLAAVFLFLGTLLHARYYFDRYLLIVLPFVIAATATTACVRLSRTAVVAAGLLAWYAVAGTHDYLAWNRARFAGLAALEARGIPPTAIDGGMEYNGWLLAPTLGTSPTEEEARPGQRPDVKSWWWVVDDRFVASFRPLPGYVVSATLPYARWLVPGTGHVVILERASATPR